jgi:hypothetical protein
LKAVADVPSHLGYEPRRWRSTATFTGDCDFAGVKVGQSRNHAESDSETRREFMRTKIASHERIKDFAEKACINSTSAVLDPQNNCVRIFLYANNDRPSQLSVVQSIADQISDYLLKAVRVSNYPRRCRNGTDEMTV